MEITPACYTHLLTPLMSLANGRVAVVLEGGYCLESLAEGAALTLRTLLGDPCPLLESLAVPSDSIQATIMNCIYAHRMYWKSLQLQELYDLEEFNNLNPQPNLHKVEQVFKGSFEVPERYETRDAYPVQSQAEKVRIAARLNHLKLVTDLTFPTNRSCYVYDDFMLQHQNLFEK
jgi:histone deacetylase 6